jgi:hypothetical protein
MMRAAVATLVSCSLAACTLLESKDGLVGPPAGAGAADASMADATAKGDASVDATGATDATAGDDTAGETPGDAPVDTPGDTDATTRDAGPDDAASDRDAGEDATDSSGPPEDASDERDAPSDADSGAPLVVLYDRPAPPLGITLIGIGTAAERVCWVEGQAPRALFCGPAAGGASPTALHGAGDIVYLADAFDLALDAKYVYWSTGSGNQVVRKQLPDGGAAPYYNGDTRVSFLALDGTDVWATDYSDGTTQTNLGNVIMGPSSDASLNSSVLYPGQAHASGVAVYASNVFWGRSDALVYGVKMGMQSPNRIPSPGGAIGGVAADPSGNIYFLVGGQALWRVVQGGTRPELFFMEEQPFGTGDVAADDGWVYWTEPTLNRVVRRAK